ncbi:MAG: DMT family transporter [Desulfobacteraceae bacterium]
MYTERKKGVAVVSAGVLVISVDALLVRLAHTDSWNVVFWRGLFIFISLGLLLGIRSGRHLLSVFMRGGWAAFFSSVLFGLGGTLFVSSVMYTRVANTVVIISSAPLFAALFTRLFLKEAVPLRTWSAIGVGIGGVVLVFSGSLGGGGLPGDVIAVLAACNVGANFTLLRRRGDLDRMPLVCAGGLVMAMIALPFAQPWGLAPESYIALGTMGLLQMPLALFLIAQSTRFLPSPEVSLFLLVETVLSPIWVWLVLGEEPPGLTLVGAAMIVPTLVVHSWMGMRHRAPVAPVTPELPPSAPVQK